VIYVYAIGDGQAGVATPGLDDFPVEAVDHGRLTAFVSRVPWSSVDARPATLERHDSVVSELMDGGTVLPVRFGTLVRDDAGLRDSLDARGAALARSLDRVRDRVELGVRAVWSVVDDPQAVSRSGSEFMAAKLARRSAARRVADEVHPPLAELAADARRSLLVRDDTPFTGAYLVEDGDRAEFARRVAGLDSALRDVELVFTGPWPPYSFSEVRDG
jgi:hypothetical protein